MEGKNESVLFRLPFVVYAFHRHGATSSLWTVASLCTFLLLLVYGYTYSAVSSWPQAAHDSRRTNYAPIDGIDNPSLAPMFPEGQEPFTDSAEGSSFCGRRK